MMSTRSSSTSSSSSSKKKASRADDQNDDQNDYAVAADATAPFPSPFWPPMPPLQNEPNFFAIDVDNDSNNDNNNNISRSSWPAPPPTAQEYCLFSPFQHHDYSYNNNDDMMLLLEQTQPPPALRRQEHVMPPPWALLPPPPPATMNMYQHWDSSSTCQEEHDSMMIGAPPPPLLSQHMKMTTMTTTNADSDGKLWNTAAVNFASNLLDSAFAAEPPPSSDFYPAAQTTGTFGVTSNAESSCLSPPSTSSQGSVDSKGTSSSSSSTKPTNTDAGADKNKTMQRPWTAKEDAQLKQAVKIEGREWTTIASKYFHNSDRNRYQIKSHWTKSLDPALKRAAWTQAENAAILRCKEQGMGFAEIAERLPGRTATTVRKQFQNHIDPTLNKALPTTAEMSKLKEEVDKYVNKNISWVEIVKLFPGRSPDQLKNWWNNAKSTHMKKSAAKKRPPSPPPPPQGDDADNETVKKRQC